jgi:imidazolonepropionase-like amidohydrolase
MNRLIACALVCAGAALGAAPSGFAIRNARIVVVSGPPIEKGTVVLRGGLIESVGAGVSAPPDVWVIDGEGLTVYPGLIDALSTIGLPDLAVPTSAPSRAATPARPPAPAPAAPPSQGPEDRPATTSWVAAADLIQTSDHRIESFRSAGFTTAATFPVRGIFGGQGAIIDLAGEKPGQMVVVPNIGQYITMSTSGSYGSFPGSLMGTMAYIRQLYLDAAHYRLVKAAYASNTRGAVRPVYDRALEGVIASSRVLLPAVREVEIARMIRFGQELKQPFILYGLHEGYGAANLLKRSGVAVLVSLKWPEPSRDADPMEQDPLRVLEMRDKAPGTPAALAAAGVKFAFYSDGLPAPRDVLRAVKKAIDAGLTPEDAVRAMTLSAAELYGVSDRLGSVEPGKIANLVVTKGDLFQNKTEVKYIFVDGEKFLPAPEPSAAAQRREGQ